MEFHSSKFTRREFLMIEVTDKIKKLQPIDAKKLKALLTVEKPFLSPKRADEYILTLIDAGKAKIDKDGLICLNF